MAAETSLSDFRRTLQNIIADQSNGLLLDAEEVVNSKGMVKRVPGAVFELTSSRCQRHYVTLWGLFEKRELFARCIEHLAKLALTIRSDPERWYSTIVTCTATAKHIMEHLHAAIETDEEEVEVHYLSPYPFHNAERQRLLDFKEKSVLIVTDVVASGSLVRNLADTVKRLGGRPTAVLGVVALTDASLAPDRNPESPIGEIEGNLPLFAITDYAIPSIGELKNGQKSDRLLRKINPSTILPDPDPDLDDTATFRPKVFNALFKDEEALDHFEAANALDFGFYEFDGRRFTTAFRLKNLYEHECCGKEIWERIQAYIPDGTTVATTYGREDLRFHDFVVESAAHCGRSIRSIFIPRSDAIDADFAYFLLPPTAVEQSARPRIVLLLASLHTSEKLRKLVSLLALHPISDITVLCMVNRMGSRTASFISRIRKLLHGVHIDADEGYLEGELSDEHANFIFVTVYNVTDVKSNELARMQQIVEALAADYASQTPEPAFRSLIGQEMRYFRPLSVTARRFETERPRPLTKGDACSLLLNGQEVHLKSKDGKLFCICSHASATRNYLSIIEAIKSETEKATLYQLFAILLADVSYLRISRQFEILRSVLIERIRHFRALRFTIERELADAELKGPYASRSAMLLDIENYVEIETYFLFGLSLFSYLDHDRRYPNLIIEFLTSGIENIHEWNHYPYNLRAYYLNERVLWCISLLLHFTQKEYRDEKNETELKQTLKGIIDDYIQFTRAFPFPELRTSSGEFTPQAAAKWVKQNFDSLLRELGIHEQRRRHQIIRFLHTHLIEPKDQHNPILKSLKRAFDDLSTNLARSRAARRSASAQRTELPPTARTAFSGSQEQIVRLKRNLEDAIHAAAILEGIADGAARFFSFHPEVGEQEIERYVAGGQGSLHADVKRLRELLQEVRSRHAISREDVRVFRRLQTKLNRELTLENSPLIMALLGYVTPLIGTLRQAMEGAERYLSLDYTEVWRHRLDEGPRFLEEHEVLFDALSLQEIFWNLLTNVRHNLNEARRRGDDLTALVDWSVELVREPAPPPEVDLLEYVVLQIVSPAEGYQLGGAARSAVSTLTKQSSVIEQFGGSLFLREEASRLISELRLVSRREVKQSWESKKISKEK